MNRRLRQLGQSMTEFVIILPVLFLLIFGAIQFGLIYQAKVTLNYAAFEAARAGATNNGGRAAIETAFYGAMAALYTNAPNFEAAMAARQRLEAEPERLCIERLNPTVEAFNDFAVWNADLGSEVIPSDNLMYRDPTPGHRSRLPVQDANLLKLRVNYCYKLVVPFVNDAIRILLGTGDADPVHNPDGEWHRGFDDYGGFRHRCLTRLSGLPIQAQAIMRMQSPAVDDLFPASCN